MEDQVLIYKEMPYEKFEKYGLEALTDSDLLAILLRTGTSDMDVQELAQYLLTYGAKEQIVSEPKTSLISLYNLSYEELQQVKGIGKIKDCLL